MPDFLPGGSPQSKYSSPRCRIVRVPVREGEVSSVSACCPTPLDSSKRATLANSRLPDDFTLPVGIERVNHSRFLPADQFPLPIRQRHKDGRRSKIKIVPRLVGAVLSARGYASNVPAVFRSQLPMPEHLSVTHAKGDHGVGVGSWGIRITVSCCDVDFMRFGVDGGG